MVIKIHPGNYEFVDPQDSDKGYKFVPLGPASAPVWIRAGDVARVRPHSHLTTICCIDVHTHHSTSQQSYVIEETPKAFSARLNDVLRLAVTPLTAAKAKECEKEADPPSNDPPAE